jgi:hypothetical protein
MHAAASGAAAHPVDSTALLGMHGMQATLQPGLQNNSRNCAQREVHDTCLRALSRASLLLWSHCMLLVLLSAGLRPCAL